MKLNCVFCNEHVALLHLPAELRAEPPDPCGPGTVPAQGDSPGPGLSPLGSAVQRPDPAADIPPTVHPSFLLALPGLKVKGFIHVTLEMA